MSSEHLADKNEANADKTPAAIDLTEDAASGPDKRVQWSEGDPLPDEPLGDDNEEETKRKQIEDLKRKLQHGGQGEQVPAGREAELGKNDEDHYLEQYLNFEGADGEFTIPEGETEGLPSLAARKRLANDKSKVGSWLGKVLKPKATNDEKNDVEANNRDSTSEMSYEEPVPPPATTGPTSVLGGLMALKEADNNSASSTPTASVKSDSELDEKIPEGPPIFIDEEKQAPTLTPTPSQQTPSESPTPVKTPGGSFKPSSLSHFHKYNPASLVQKGVSKGMSGAISAASTPGKMAKSVISEAKKSPSQKAERKRARKERKKNEILLNLAALIERQEFLLKLTRALMMFGSPSHRLEAVIQNTGRFLEAPVQCMFTPGVMTMSFSDSSTRTSDTKFIKQASGLDLARLPDTHKLYSDVLHGKVNVTDASAKLDEIMLSPPTYNVFTTICIGMLCSAAITPMAFDGSFIDALMAAVLGAILVITQMIVAKKESFSSIFEILIAALNSFLAACLAYSRYFCFKAVVSGSIVLILPAGSVRMFYAIIYALLLGFGIGFGAELWYLFTNKDIDTTNDCSAIQGVSGQHWYMRHAPDEYNILLAPLFVIGLSLRNQTRIMSKEFPLMVFIGCAGYAVNYFSTHNDRFGGRADLASALSSFTVGIIGNIIGRLTTMSAYVLMVPGILFVLPSGFGQFGLLSFADVGNDDSATTDATQAIAQNITSIAGGGSTDASATQAIAQSLMSLVSSGGDSTNASATQAIAQNLISIANGLTVGLFFSSALINPSSSSSRRKQTANFSF
ncbi:DUF1212-domain-containing protein [Wallemia mellicola]|nr:DUF1212-domain-containing protein [Wallemia mellicola]